MKAKNLALRVRLRILALRIRILNVRIVLTITRQITLNRRYGRLVLRSDALGKRYRDLEGTTE